MDFTLNEMTVLIAVARSDENPCYGHLIVHQLNTDGYGGERTTAQGRVAPSTVYRIIHKLIGKGYFKGATKPDAVGQERFRRHFIMTPNGWRGFRQQAQRLKRIELLLPKGIERANQRDLEDRDVQLG